MLVVALGCTQSSPSRYAYCLLPPSHCNHPPKPKQMQHQQQQAKLPHGAHTPSTQSLIVNMCEYVNIISFVCVIHSHSIHSINSQKQTRLFQILKYKKNVSLNAFRFVSTESACVLSRSHSPRCCLSLLMWLLFAARD